jgi:hypothetical protein
MARSRKYWEKANTRDLTEKLLHTIHAAVRAQIPDQTPNLSV